MDIAQIARGDYIITASGRLYQVVELGKDGAGAVDYALCRILWEDPILPNNSSLYPVTVRVFQDDVARLGMRRLTSMEELSVRSRQI